jgi:autotransporter family porin
MVNARLIWSRVDGNFTGTTDEIIQWAAAKWGLPDNLIRAEAVVESYWYQGLKTPSGDPVEQRGYGDFGACGGSPTPAGYGAPGPASFGLLQDKWCSFQDPGAPGWGGWPWTERSTAYSVDLYAATIRGCYQGWDTWLGNGYVAGDIWGCVGRWFSGQWHTPVAEGYIQMVMTNVSSKPWLTW